MMRQAPPTFHPAPLSRPTIATLALGLALWVAPARGELVFSDGFEFLPSPLQALVVWEDDPDLNGVNDIRFGSNGEPVIDRRANASTAGEQLTPGLALADDEAFVVVWANDGNNNRVFDIFARGFNADGSERIPTFTVNTNSSGQQLQPAIAMAAYRPTPWYSADSFTRMKLEWFGAASAGLTSSGHTPRTAMAPGTCCST